MDLWSLGKLSARSVLSLPVMLEIIGQSLMRFTRASMESTNNQGRRGFLAGQFDAIGLARKQS
jgi:hypothetical protein